MSGAIGISDDQTWYTNGWGWRQLLEQAVQVASPEYQELVARYRVQPGLTLPLLAEKDRIPVAQIMRSAATDLVAKYEHSDDDYERRYADRLRDLITMLNDQIATLQPSD